MAIINDGGFIGAAGVEHAGHRYDDDVMNTLAHFRDSYMALHPEGSKEIEWYYKNSPQIMSKINRDPHGKQISNKIFSEFVYPAYTQIKRGHPEKAHDYIRKLAQFAHNFTGHAKHMKAGGALGEYSKVIPKHHNPEFITGHTGHYVQGRGTGQSDDVPAVLHDGDYVVDADTVAALGDGSSKAGGGALEHFRRSLPEHHAGGGQPIPAQIADGEYVLPAGFVTTLGHGSNKEGAKMLDAMREQIRAHKRSAPDTKIPPKAKSPLEYLKEATKG
jgi:hypothetical protein